MEGVRIQQPADPGEVAPVIAPGLTYESVTEQIGSIVITKKPPREWIVGFGLAFLLAQALLLSAAYLLYKGVGIWGINQPVGWGFAIINFVWWIGIGHAGTLISAILLLMKQEWRTSINRFAEAMTLFAVACAGLFPLLHMGRPWLFYWLFPYPNTMAVWPQFRSPLVWDVFAVSTYALVSLMFWYVGLVPDLATLRDRAGRTWQKRTFGVFALGWRGSAAHWHRYEMAYLLLAGLSTPLVVSVHSVVSLDFAVSVIPGWHSTIFPPYFVAGAIYAGFAMVLTLVIPLRKLYGLKNLVTPRHLDNMAKVMLATGLMVFYGYLCELFFAFYSGNPYEQFMMKNRALGPYAWLYWALIFCNGLAPQVLWFRRVRMNNRLLFAVSVVVSIGMWLERFVIVVTSLHRDFMPGAWRMYTPTFWDISLFLGTIGFFFSLIFLFVRGLPMISIFEVRDLVHSKSGRRG